MKTVSVLSRKICEQWYAFCIAIVFLSLQFNVLVVLFLNYHGLYMPSSLLQAPEAVIVYFVKIC